VVVDDGSTDDSEAVVRRVTARWPQTVTVVRQANAGAYAARNTALNRAAGDLIAFYDSDDVWMPQYLGALAGQLDGAPDVDWVTACHSAPRDRSAHRSRHVRRRQAARVRDLRTTTRRAQCPRRRTYVEWALSTALRGLQNSVIRRSAFEVARFRTAFRNEAEDQLFVIRALKRGHRLGYLDSVYVEYHVHDANSSASATGKTVDRDLSVYRPVARGFEELAGECHWSPRGSGLASASLSFWHIGYAAVVARPAGEALESFRAGLRAWPWDPGSWKTYALARVRTLMQGDIVSDAPRDARL
jgi:glycosyltransferase involved in cell wall biosynthesis